MLGWIPFHDEVKINKCVSVYKKLRGESPSYIDNLQIINYSDHGRQTRYGQYNLVCPRYTHASEV